MKEDKVPAAKQTLEDKKEHDEKVKQEAEKDVKESTVPKPMTAALSDAEYKVNLEEGKEAKANTTKGMASGLIQHPDDPNWLIGEDGRRYNPNDVKFEVKYASGFKGDKHMPEGITIVSQEVAEQLESLHIGKIVK